jgi:hypothetical protein
MHIELIVWPELDGLVCKTGLVGVIFCLDFKPDHLCVCLDCMDEGSVMVNLAFFYAILRASLCLLVELLAKTIA